MNTFGHALLVLLIFACIAGLGLALASASSRSRGASATRWVLWAVYVVTGLTILASITLVVQLLTRDFSNLYVSEYTNRALSGAYRFSAFWAGNAGSLLLWLLVLSIFSLIALRQMRKEAPDAAPYTAAIFLAISLFFSLLLIFGNKSNPFAGQPGGVIPPDGQGLNPILHNPGMVIHPVALYLGYVGCAIPFAVVFGGLIARSPSSSWLPALRRWALIGWLFLTIGNLVGAWWAYVTLGWGGYWGWDPVENASLMPWLTAAAVVHGTVMLRKRKMLRMFTVVMVAITFLLTIFGTFLTRSGIATSVHAFADNSFIPWFTTFLLIAIAFVALVLGFRRAEIRSEKHLDSLTTRESAFYYTNFLLSLLAFVVFMGVLYPTVQKAITGAQVGLNTTYFSSTTVPLALILLLLTGICPLLPWRGSDPKQLKQDALWTVTPAVIALIVVLVLGVRKPYTIISFTFATFTFVSVLVQYARGLRNRRKATGKNWLSVFGGMIWTNRSRYGGFVVHIGLVVVLVGITGSYAFKQVVDTDVTKGQTVTLGSYVLTYQGLATTSDSEKTTAKATFAVGHDGKAIGYVYPVKEYYPASDQTWTRVDLYSTATVDVYVSLLGYSADGSSATIQAQLNPLVGWLWFGGGVMVLGGLIAMWPSRRLRTKEAALAPAVAGPAQRART